MKNRAIPWLLALLALSAATVLALEFRWRSANDLLKPPSPSPDGDYVAEVRATGTQGPAATGVYVRPHWAWLRSVRPRLVFIGDCEEVDARWFGPRRLVIDCELRAGQPRVLEHLLDDLVIEVVVQRPAA